MADQASKDIRRYNKHKLEWLRMFKTVLAAAVVLFLIFRFVLGISIVNGISMQPALQNGDLVLYTRIFNTIHPGDVVACTLPSGEHVVKRVVAVEGDTVDIRDGILYVNGQPETRETENLTLPESLVIQLPLKVSAGSAFILGDNRADSEDSRRYGPISLDNIQGILRLHMGWLFFETDF